MPETSAKTKYEQIKLEADAVVKKAIDQRMMRDHA